MLSTAAATTATVPGSGRDWKICDRDRVFCIKLKYLLLSTSAVHSRLGWCSTPGKKSSNIERVSIARKVIEL